MLPATRKSNSKRNSYFRKSQSCWRNNQSNPEAFLCNVPSTSRTLLFSDKAWVYKRHFVWDCNDCSVAQWFGAERGKRCTSCPIFKIHSYETKKSVQDNYYIIRTNTEFARRSLSVCGPLIWSEVPHELKNLSFPNLRKVSRSI